MRAKGRSVAWEIAKIASRQHGNVTRQQLLELGLSSAGVGRRVANGVLHPEFRAVYRVGHRAPSIHARYAAAVLACGEGAALCGAAEAYLLGFTRGTPPPPEVMVEAYRRVRGVIVHRPRALLEDEIRLWDGIRVMTIPRLLVDLAARVPLDELARIHHQAWVRFKV